MADVYATGGDKQTDVECIMNRRFAAKATEKKWDEMFLLVNSTL